MGFLDFFSGGSPEKHEQKADSFVIGESYGHAKTEYENALDKLDRQVESNPGYRRLIEDKLLHCKEALALEHRRNGETLAEAGCDDEARELLHLALELTADPRLSTDIKKLLDSILVAADKPEDYVFHDDIMPGTGPDEEDDPGSEDEYFTALCNSLDDVEQDEYHSYPDTFRQGYIALNRGDFKTAVTLLSEAHNAYPLAAGYITLELATAHLNLGDNDRARELLEYFLTEHPESLKAYYLMCESLWESKAFDAAGELLSNCPENLSGTLAIKMLTGETLLRSERYEEAVSFFREILETGSWDNTVAQTLARAYEALGYSEKAKALYAEIMDACAGCRAKVDPVVKLRYAETSFATGDFSTKILELYLNLAREDPDNRLDCYRRISHIYSHQGNENESRRFAVFAQRLAEEDKTVCKTESGG
ncbi:MAG: tetratricopeptide repeat protein [Deltaproteobacteria bacterium]|nr:tetratricopeptide repeat protein [Deltaproteobacteria bacterium]